MLFCLSVDEETARVILDDSLHGELLAVIEAENWTEARQQALRQKEMDPYTYRAGWGWVLRVKS